MKKDLFHGAATALVTPFRDGKVDGKTLMRLVEYQIRQGIDALVICGTTGEAPTLSALEKLHCISWAAEAAEGRVPIIAGTGSNDTDFSARLSALAAREGADAILTVAPYYNKPPKEGIIRHFEKIAEASGLPQIAYNIPSRTGIDISPETFDTITKQKLLCGIKEASGNLTRIAKLCSLLGDQVPVYSGNDDQILPVFAVGGKGVISVVSNLLPTETHLLWELWEQGRVKEALKLYREILPLTEALFAETNPIPVKAAMEQVGFCEGSVRLPLTTAAEETRRKLKDAMKDLIGTVC